MRARLTPCIDRARPWQAGPIPAHIISDGDEAWGQPIVPNGIPPSKIRHAAFDAHLIGIDPDFRVHVAERLRAQNDGPMLEDLKRLHLSSLHLPSRDKDRPDRDRLAQRFESFTAAQQNSRSFGLANPRQIGFARSRRCVEVLELRKIDVQSTDFPVPSYLSAASPRGPVAPAPADATDSWRRFGQGVPPPSKRVDFGRRTLVVPASAATLCSLHDGGDWVGAVESTRFELIVSLKVAKAIGLTIP